MTPTTVLYGTLFPISLTSKIHAKYMQVGGPLFIMNIFTNKNQQVRNKECSMNMSEKPAKSS